MTTSPVSMHIEVIGYERVMSYFDAIRSKSESRCARAGLHAGGAVIAKEIRKEIAAKTNKRSGRLRRSVGKKVKRDAQHHLISIIGFNVGKKKKPRTAKEFALGESLSYAPHAAVIALGTKARKTKKGVSRGAGSKIEIIPAALGRARLAALAAMKTAFDKKLDKIASKGAR